MYLPNVLPRRKRLRSYRFPRASCCSWASPDSPEPWETGAAPSSSTVSTRRGRPLIPQPCPATLQWATAQGEPSQCLNQLTNTNQSQLLHRDVLLCWKTSAETIWQHADCLYLKYNHSTLQSCNTMTTSLRDDAMCPDYFQKWSFSELISI